MVFAKRGGLDAVRQHLGAQTVQAKVPVRAPVSGSPNTARRVAYCWLNSGVMRVTAVVAVVVVVSIEVSSVSPTASCAAATSPLVAVKTRWSSVSRSTWPPLVSMRTPSARTRCGMLHSGWCSRSANVRWARSLYVMRVSSWKHTEEAAGALVCDEQVARTCPFDPTAGQLDENCARHTAASQEEHVDTAELPANEAVHAIPLQQLQLQQMFPEQDVDGAVVEPCGAVVVKACGAVVVVVVGAAVFQHTLTSDAVVKSHWVDWLQQIRKAGFLPTGIVPENVNVCWCNKESEKV